MKRIDETKLCNKCRDFEIRAKGGMRFKQAVSEIDKTDTSVIIIHAGTNNLS